MRAPPLACVQTTHRTWYYNIPRIIITDTAVIVPYVCHTFVCVRVQVATVLSGHGPPTNTIYTFVVRVLYNQGWSNCRSRISQKANFGLYQDLYRNTCTFIQVWHGQARNEKILRNNTINRDVSRFNFSESIFWVLCSIVVDGILVTPDDVHVKYITLHDNVMDKINREIRFYFFLLLFLYTDVGTGRDYILYWPLPRLWKRRDAMADFSILRTVPRSFCNDYSTTMTSFMSQVVAVTRTM